MGQRGLLFATWEAEWEPDWTALFYQKTRRSQSDICGCVYCRLWNARRDALLCGQCRTHLARLGADLRLDTGNAPVLLDDTLVYLAQFRVKGQLVAGGVWKEYACSNCGTKVWVEQDRWERNMILIHMSVTVPLDASAREAIRASKDSGGAR